MIIRLHILPTPLLLSSSTPNPNPIPLKPLSSAATTTNSPDAGLLFRHKLLYLQSLKLNPTKALLINPNLRSTPLSTIQSVQHCLSSIGIHPSAQSRILEMNPVLLSSDPYTHIYPVFDFLLNVVQIPFPDISKCIVVCPRLLVCSVEKQLIPTFAFLESLGFVGSNRLNTRTALLLVYSVEHTLIPKIRYLEDMGFCNSEVKEMVLRSPALLTYSIENNLKPKMEFLLEEMNRDLGDVKKFPQYLSFCLEGKIKPRHRLLVDHGLRISLSEMLKFSDGEFNSRLIDMRLRSVYKRR